MELFFKQKVPGTLIENESPIDNNNEPSKDKQPNASTVRQYVNKRKSNGQARPFFLETQIDSTGRIESVLTTTATQIGTNTPAYSTRAFRSNQSQNEITTIEPTRSAILFETSCFDQSQDGTTTIEPTASVDLFGTCEFGHSQHETITAEDSHSIDLFGGSCLDETPNETTVIQASRTDCPDESQDGTSTIGSTGRVYSFETLAFTDSDESMDGTTDHNDRIVAYNVSQGVKTNGKDAVKSVAALTLIEELENSSDHAIVDRDCGSQNSELNELHAEYDLQEVETSQEKGKAETDHYKIVYFPRDDYVECIELPGTNSTKLTPMEIAGESSAATSTEVAILNEVYFEPFRSGQLMWAQMSKCPFWPTIVCPDGDGIIVNGKPSH